MLFRSYYDSETGLYYLQTRYYDPEIGRFISPDSTKYLDPESINGLNLYAYCLNNPVMYEDPTGHSLTLATIIATLASATYAFGFSFLTTISSPEYSEMSVEEKINIGLRNGLISMGFDLITGVAGIALNAAKHAKYVVVANVALSIGETIVSGVTNADSWGQIFVSAIVSALSTVTLDVAKISFEVFSANTYKNITIKNIWNRKIKFNSNKVWTSLKEIGCNTMLDIGWLIADTISGFYFVTGWENTNA